ncbi:hypothetical protein V6B08_03360 [Ferrovibrio sp. MS7]|uniref:hypothetical protein n=1 Tax=Ferrovibrio plantarum TaxID=3119164 RepID=UPI003136B01C
MNTLTNSQNKTHSNKPNVLSKLDKRVADGVAADKAASKAQPDVKIATGVLPTPAKHGGNSTAKQ